MLDTIARRDSKYTSFVDAAAVLGLIEAAAGARRPFSLIRFSHCESRIAGFHLRRDRAEVMKSIRHQWGAAEPSDDDLMLLSRAVAAAMLEADVIALNDRDRPGAQPALAEIERSAHELAYEIGLIDGRPVARVSVHWALGRDAGFRALLARQRRLVLVTGRSGAAARVSAWLCGPEVIQILAPGHARQSLGDGAADRHYPEGLERMLAEMSAIDVEGTMVLVGAGILGKVMCGEARRDGGIAIDVGSLFDAWCGHKTRTTMPDGLELPGA